MTRNVLVGRGRLDFDVGDMVESCKEREIHTD